MSKPSESVKRRSSKALKPRPGEAGFRSWVMSRVRSRDTKPEMLVRRLLHGLGYRYRLHGEELPGSPDLVFPRKKMVIWVHGCFWHGHGCRNGVRLPKTNVEFWSAKRRANMARDQRSALALESMGWKALVLWECELRDLTVLELRIRNFLGPPKSARMGKKGYNCG